MKLFWLALLLTLNVLPAWADRDIVYSARYYYPPGDHRTSHFHLYCINPEGTGRTQLTFGQTDDEAPQWSPDGRHIAFWRGGSAVCILPAAGGSARVLLTFPAEDSLDWGPSRWLPDCRTVAIMHSRSTRTATVREVLLIDTITSARRRIAGASDYFPSPDGQRAYLPGDGEDRLWETVGNSFVHVSDPVESPVWQDAQTLVGLAGDPEKDGYLLRTLGSDGRERHRAALRLPDTVPNLDGAPREAAALLMATPAPRRRLVYSLNNHNSTVGVDWVYLMLDPNAGTTRYLAEGQFLAWSPDGIRFCIAPGRDTAVYERRRDGTERTVWAAPLQVGLAAGGTLKTITHGLVWVTWADWRHSGYPKTESLGQQRTL